VTEEAGTLINPRPKDAPHAPPSRSRSAPDGWLTDIDPGHPGLRPQSSQKLIGCVAVHPILFAADLLSWVADTVDNTPLNVVALVMTTADIPYQTAYGTLVP
jgi:hypothetical protein